MPPRDKRPALEVERVLQHYLEDGEIRYRVSWKFYPEKASTFADCLERDSKEILFEYHKKIGVLDAMGKVIMEKLFATAIKEPATFEDYPVIAIEDHFNDANGALMFQTRFKDGSLINRPQYAFAEVKERAMVKAYLKKHGLDESTPKPRKAVKAETLAHQRESVRLQLYISSDDDDDGEEQPGSSDLSRARSRSNWTGISEGSEIKLPITGTKRAASPSRSVANKRQKTIGHKDNTQRKFYSLVLDDGDVLKVLFKDSNGHLSEKDVDSVFEEDPKAVLDALKKFAIPRLKM